MTNEQLAELKKLAELHEIRPSKDAHRIINMHGLLFPPRAICSHCPDALWQALVRIKAHYASIINQVDSYEKKEEEKI